MKEDLCFPGKAHIGQEIMAYLIEHPDAQDTLDGILQWWLLERKIRYQMEQVREALTELVDRKWVLECKSRDSRIRYRMNPIKSGEIRKILKQQGEAVWSNESEDQPE